MPPSVSVVTAVYNGADYFDRAIPSILDQTHEDFEFVIVDDGSTDGTAERLAEVERRDSRVRVLRPGRIGFVPALNLGVSEAKGRYIARQDFDDVSYRNRLALQSEWLDQNEDVGVIGGYYVLIDEKRDECYVRKPPLSHENIVRSMPKGIPFAHTCVMFRKSAWQQAGGYPEVEDIEDLRMWVDFARNGWKLANIPHVIGEHFVHMESYWHRNFSYWKRQRALARAQWKAIRDLDLPLWMGVYPLARSIYPLVPRGLKRVVRRSIGDSEESDVSVTQMRRRYRQ